MGGTVKTRLRSRPISASSPVIGFFATFGASIMQLFQRIFFQNFVLPVRANARLRSLSGFWLLSGGGYSIKSEMGLRIKKTSWAILAGTAAFWVVPGAASSQVYDTLVDLGGFGTGTYSEAFGVSADGTTVVGTATDSSWQEEAFRWTSGGGMIGLGFLGTGTTSYAIGTNADGTTVVGVATNSSSQNEAYRWTSGGGMVGLGFLGTGTTSSASGISADGTTVVGTARNSSSQSEAFRWTSGGGMVGLGFLGTGTASYAMGTNADGTTVVGTATDSSWQEEAFRWTSGGGMVGLGFLGTGTTSSASGISADGTTVVGTARNSSSQDEAYRWTSGGGMVGLGFLGTGTDSDALGVSADGTTVVGTSRNSSSQNEAFRWTSGGGMVGLGFLGTGTYSDATGVSADGSVVVGISDNGVDLRAYIYRTLMLDLANTQTAIAGSAFEQAGLATLRTEAANSLVATELEISPRNGGAQVTGSSQGGNMMPMAIRLGGAFTSNADVGSESRSNITAALGVSSRMTLGGFYSTGPETSNLGTITTNGNPTALGLYLRSRNEDRLGTTWKVSAAQNGGDLTITRSVVLADTEAGQGDTSLNTTGAQLEYGHGFQSSGMIATPFLRFNYGETTRSGYTEANTVSFPVTYDDYKQDLLTATLGVSGRVTLKQGTALDFGGGVETDIHRSAKAITGTSDVPGMTTFNFASPDVVNSARAFLNFKAKHNLPSGSAISLGGNVTQSAYSTAPTVNLGLWFVSQF